MTPDIQKLILVDNVTDFDIEGASVKNGSLTMAQDGLLKALAGDTSLKEVLKVIQ
jgi:type II secretory ATPase GspE/PulE/Tfp pilus assembly ATPase PilB-like protein